ncbi:MAG: hypothetical protein ACOH12_07450 [Parvibaculaceae bacterium]
MKPIKRALTLGFILVLCASAPASAAQLMSAKPAPQGTCELTCQYREGAGPKRITSCTQHMTNTQCQATADHKNLSDAYPNKMICTAKLNETCEAAREF